MMMLLTSERLRLHIDIFYYLGGHLRSQASVVTNDRYGSLSVVFLICAKE